MEGLMNRLTQCLVVVKNSEAMQGIIRKGFENRTNNIEVLLYRTIQYVEIQCRAIWCAELQWTQEDTTF